MYGKGFLVVGAVRAPHLHNHADCGYLLLHRSVLESCYDEVPERFYSVNLKLL